MSSLTANQHYVWQHYLRAWCTPTHIWCQRSQNSEPFETSPRNIGSKRFFYEFYELTAGDLAYIKAIISRSNSEEQRKLNWEWVNAFQKTFVILKQLNDVELQSDIRGKIESELREIEKTLGESFHSSIEDRAIPILNALREGDTSFYADDKASTNFINYISHQYFRTEKLQRAVQSIPHQLSHHTNRTWPVEAFIYATNLASSLVQQRREYRIVILRNKSDIPFITGDQPVINLRSFNETEVDLYYPVQPNIAVVFTADRNRHFDTNISQLGVNTYNHLIYAESNSQIYGNDPIYLKSFSQLPKEVRS